MQTITTQVQKHQRDIIRDACERDTRYNVPIEIIQDSDTPPTKTGTSWHYETKTGIVIRHPSAYTKKGFGNMRYVHASDKIIVGQKWIDQHCPSKTKYHLPTISNLKSLLIELKTQISDDYRIEYQSDNIPTMQITIGASNKDRDNWAYQTGDNSYSGPVYSYPLQATVYLQRRSNSTKLARDIINQLKDQIWEEN